MSDEKKKDRRVEAHEHMVKQGRKAADRMLKAKKKQDKKPSWWSKKK